MNRRDLLLQEMGLNQWTLVRPERLHGAMGIEVGAHIRLVIVSEQRLSGEPLLNDILLSLSLPKEAYLNINFAQLPHLSANHNLQYWLLNENSAEIDRTLPYCVRAERIYRSTDWQAFKQSPTEKRQLWQQIQQPQIL